MKFVIISGAHRWLGKAILAYRTLKIATKKSEGP
jgi:hypothetical protein